MKPKCLIVFVILLCTACACGADDFPKWKPRISVPVGGSPLAIRYSPDGKQLAVGYSDGTVKILSVDAGSVTKTIASDVKPIWNVHFLPASNRLVVCGGGGVQTFSTTDWSQVAQAEGILGCDVSDDEKLLVGNDGKSEGEALVLWDLRELKLLQPLFSNGARPVNPTFVKGGSLVAFTASRTPYLVDINTRQATKIRQDGDAKTSLKIEKLQGNQAAISLGPMQDDDAPSHNLTASYDGSLIALGRGWYGQEDFIDVWTTDMTRLARIKAKLDSPTASFCSDNKLVAVGSARSGKIVIYRLADKKKTNIAGSDIFLFSPKALELAMIQDGNVSFYVPSR